MLFQYSPHTLKWRFILPSFVCLKSENMKMIRHITVGCSELGEIRDREINGYEPKRVTVNWKVCRGFRKTQWFKHCQMLNLQQPLGACCKLSFWATSDSSDFRKPLHTFEIGWNSVTLSCGFRSDLRLRRCAYRFRTIYALWHYL